MLKVIFIFLFTEIILSSCSDKYSIENLGLLDSSSSNLSWKWIETDKGEIAAKRLVYEELFGDGNSIRLHQSMCIYGSTAFCFNHGKECRVYDVLLKERLITDSLPDKSHHNNAQFSHFFYDEKDAFPFLFLSRGDYPPNQNEFYVIQIGKDDQIIDFKVNKTIYNRIQEANYGGSWVIDDEHGKMYLYCMTTGDWRKKENNVFCVYSFLLPDIYDKEDVTLGYEDVLERWEYTYLIPQGGTYCNGYLFFNVQSLKNVYGKTMESSKCVIAINTSNGHIDFYLPLDDPKETEGIAVENNKLYVSFKDGREDQSPTDIVFSLYEYSIPNTLIYNKQ